MQVGVFSVSSYRIAVGCVHLDSPPRDRPIRIAQLDAAFKVLTSLHADAALLAGDFNFADNTLETTHMAEKHGQWNDAWRVVHGANDAGITFSVSRNDLTVALFPGEADKRLDRLLYLSPHLRATEALLLGTEPIRDAEGKKILYKGTSALFPSDHFGVQVSLAVSGDAAVAGHGQPKGEQCVVS